MEHIEKATSFLQLNQLDSIKELDIIKQKAGVKVSILAFGVAFFLILFSFIVDISEFIVAIICAIIPIVLSFKSLENKNSSNENIRYMTYWVVFALTEIFHNVLAFVFNPTFLVIFRVSLTIALLNPKINLSLMIFDHAVKPFLKKKPQTLQQKVEKKLQQTAKNLIQQAKQVSNKMFTQVEKKLQ